MTNQLIYCPYCGQATYTHLGMCPRVKSITTHCDGSTTVELHSFTAPITPPILEKILKELQIINSRLLMVRA